MSDFQDKARAAARAMREVFPATPLLRNAHLSELYGADIWLKREDLSPVRSYKLRGAFNAMRKRADLGLVVCASAGNHAQGVAFMCRHFGVRGVIFMPVTTPQQKIQKTEMFGGDSVEIRLIGDYFDECLAAAKAFTEAEGAYFLSPFDDPDVIEGQASVGAEIEEQLGGVPDTLVIPVGGGGLASGLLGYFEGQPNYTFVEPKGGACLRAALEAQEPVTLRKVNTFADGAAVARIGDVTFDRLKSIGLASTLQIDEDRLCTTMLDMLNVEGIVLEPAGALSVDALKDMGQMIRGRRVVCITSGGNFDFERLPEVKERAQTYAGLKKYFILRLPQRPGALRGFLDLLGPQDDIARFEYLKKSARNFGSVLIGIETRDPGNFAKLYAKLDAGGFVYTDITEDEVLSNFII
ncbi:threonine ammonia-lyase IlvA [Tropicibacter sp. S64]|uniref:threonine ammonia-lyase IlvA n=1 Tax=Tropicibacter sp. S64 TaxID=3415122 RepID=UPI003C7D5340